MWCVLDVITGTCQGLAKELIDSKNSELMGDSVDEKSKV